MKKETDSSRLAGLIRKRTRLVLGVPARILKVDREALTGYSHIQHPDGLHNTLFSQGCVLATVSAMGTVGRSYMPRAEEEVSYQPVVSCQLSCQPVVCPLDDPLQKRRRPVEPMGSDYISTWVLSFGFFFF